MTFSALMINWLQVSSSMHGLRKFVQGNLAEPWKDDWANQEQAEANELELNYSRGDLRGDYRILAADTQTDSFWFVVRGFDRDGTSYLIDCGQVASLAELDGKFDQHSCHVAIIDCAARSNFGNIRSSLSTSREMVWLSRMEDAARRPAVSTADERSIYRRQQGTSRVNRKFAIFT